MNIEEDIIDEVIEEESDNSSSNEEDSDKENVENVEDEDYEDDEPEEEAQEDIPEEVDDVIDPLEDFSLNEEDDGFGLLDNEKIDYKPTKKKTFNINFLHISKVKNTILNNFKDSDYREEGYTSLYSFLQNEKNARTFEKYIYEESKDYMSYTELLRDIIGMIGCLKDPYNLKLKDILDMLKKKKLGFDSFYYDDIREIVKKEIKKLQLPIEVAEGVFECPKCKGKLTQSYQLQLRSADEPATIFVNCVNKTCKYKWRIG
jgi:DNA-directed RNA polymerase subunit M/transcription elongation factor TFIIS